MLGKIGAAVKPRVIDLLLARLGDDDSDVQEMAATLLGEIGVVAAEPRVIDALIALLHDPDMLLATSRALAGIGAGAEPRVVAALAALLDDTRFLVRIEAIEALGEMGTGADPRVINALVVLLGDEKTDVQYEAAHAISELGPPARSRQSSMPSSHSFVVGVRSFEKKAVWALADLGPTAATPQAIDALIACLGDAEEGVRFEAARAR